LKEKIANKYFLKLLPYIYDDLPCDCKIFNRFVELIQYVNANGSAVAQVGGGSGFGAERESGRP
jgi:hypothetical protein